MWITTINSPNYTQIVTDLQKAGKWVAGVDEVGRGSIFGPVVASAVILPTSFFHPSITDSKKLPQTKRKELADLIKANALTYAIKEASPEEIDNINILQASFLAMSRALEVLNPQPYMVMVDGHLPIPKQPYLQTAIVKGDLKVFAISCASILAKNYTDELMVKLDAQYPGYDLINNKGYGSASHFEGLKKQGITALHRKTYKSVVDFL